MKKNQLLFIFIFTILGLTTLQIPFTTVLGSGTKFTLFDFLAPTAGAFLGTVPGLISVLVMQVINIALHGFSSVGFTSLIRLFPVLFGVFYFSKNGATPKVERTPRTILINRDWYWGRIISFGIPFLAIIIFNLHPIGRSAWQYSLFWLIPIVAHFWRKNLPAQAGLFIRSLGATFTAHAVGGALWVWAFGLSKTMWLSLIPQTAMERTLMAVGISISFVVLTNLFKLLVKNKLLPFIPQLEKQYLLK
ncbi:hypothetical protein MUP32_05905 [Candidatus Microgenomates bacterium]|nr:hypothetical protein [Candidatus Microgenomates bacterium]